MEQLVHGGDWAGYRAQFGRDALDFSANVSPLGLPEGVAKAITAALPTADRYPDPLCRELRAKLALHEGVPADHILCGNGEADLIFRLVWARKPRRALVTAPTFAEYAAALETIGCTVERFILQAADDFAVPEAFLSAIDDRVDLVFLCQPNNPTGQLTPPDFVARILQRCTACGALLVLDECFLDFLPDHAQLTAKPLLGSGDLLILKAFTKLYGMAGVRLGYALSADTALLDARSAPSSRRSGPGWPPACGLWGCGCWMGAPIICCSKAPKRWARPCGRRASFCAAAQIIQVLTAAGTAPPCARRRKTSSCSRPFRRCFHEQGPVHHGPGHDERRGQKPAVRGALPHFCAGRLPRGPLQEPEHGAEQLRHPRRA